MEQMPNDFEQFMNEYQEAVDRAYAEGGQDAAAIMEMRMSIKKAQMYSEAGMADEAIEELQTVYDVTSMGGIFEGTGIDKEAEELLKQIKESRS